MRNSRRHVRSVSEILFLTADRRGSHRLPRCKERDYGCKYHRKSNQNRKSHYSHLSSGFQIHQRFCTQQSEIPLETASLIRRVAAGDMASIRRLPKKRRSKTPWLQLHRHTRRSGHSRSWSRFRPGSAHTPLALAAFSIDMATMVSLTSLVLFSICC